MTQIEDRVHAALRSIGDKPADSASRAAKKRYSESLSQAVAEALGTELRDRGLKAARPTDPGSVGGSGAERRMAGGIGAKKVDVTWATEEAGLLLAISIKSINFRDSRSKNFQKNLTNRRSDMLSEAITLHRRFPYAVLGGLFFLDTNAAADDTQKRRSTFLNAHHRFKLFTDRSDPSGREEQYEHFWFVLADASPSHANTKCYAVGDPVNEISWDTVVSKLLEQVALRNPDFYEFDGTVLKKAQ